MLRFDPERAAGAARTAFLLRRDPERAAGAARTIAGARGRWRGASCPQREKGKG